jgi:hypothetical protein
MSGRGINTQNRWGTRAMAPYEHLVAKAEEIGWPSHYKNDLLVIDRELLEGRDPTVPFLWFVRETGTYLCTSDGYGFRDDGKGTLDYICKPYTQKHRGFLWNGSQLTEVKPEDFKKAYTDWVYGSGPLWRVTVRSKWRPAPWSMERSSVNTYSVCWSKDHDSLHEYVYARLPSHEQHTIEIVPAEMEAVR